MALRNNHARWAFKINGWRPTIKELLQATACIQPEEKERLARFVFRDDFNASLIGRLLMRKFVSDSTGIEYDKVIFNRDERGKPFLESAFDSSWLDFNVSHQGSYVVLAGFRLPKADAPLPKIGIDVMKLQYDGGKPLSEFFRLMYSNFSDEEWGHIRSRGTERNQIAAFMRFWCLKESYVKNIGVGITINLQKICFTPQSEVINQLSVVTDTLMKLNEQKTDGWVFEESLLDDEHSVAVSLENCPTEENSNDRIFQVIDFDTLMNGSVPLLPYDENYCHEIMEKEYKIDR